MLTAPPPNCATGTLTPYVPSTTVPWNRQRIQHLFRRVGFGANLATIEAASSLSPDTLVEELLDQISTAPNLPQPEWYNWTIDSYDDFNQQSVEQIFAYGNEWVAVMFSQAPKEKLTLFWHNHFVTRFEDYFCPSWLYSYLQLLQTYAAGNFRDFVVEMGKNPAMLVYLNGVQNTRLEPNENYARELFELFTLGQDNGYTQADIVDAAKALTGWNGFTSACAPIGYVNLLHDPSTKTIFGQTGAWDYDDLHDLLFTERADEIAYFICQKLYTYYVHPVADEEIVAGMAATFQANDWEILPVLRQLFKSEHFFDEYVMGTQIKSPLSYMISTAIENDLPVNNDVTNFILLAGYQLGQALFNPIDVAGWPGDRTWVNTNTLTGRWQTADYIIFSTFSAAPQLLVDFAISLTSPSTNDPELVTQAIVDFLLPQGLDTPEAYAAATMVFKFEVPQNYYDSGDWNLYWETAPAQVALLLRHLSRLPEFQLF